MIEANFAGTGSAQLQVNAAGDWVPAAAAVSATMQGAVVVGRKSHCCGAGT